MNPDLEVGGNGAGEGDGRSPLHDRRREQGLLKITLTIHGLYLASNGLLYTVIQINYQNQRNSPFETHMAMKSSLIALTVYICTAAFQIRLVQINNEYPRLLKYVLVCFGILSLLSSALVFLPNMVGCTVVVLFVFAAAILLAYYVFKLISTASELVALEINVISDNAATTSESTYVTTGISHANAATTSEPVASEINVISCANAAATSESPEMNTGINNNESSRNNNDAVEMRTGNNLTGSTNTV